MKIDISGAWNAVKSFSSTHSPAILTGLGIAGMIVTVAEAVRATPKAMQLIEEQTEDIPEPKAVDKVKACWKCYVPMVVSGSVSIALLIFANRAGEKQRAALSAAYTIAETSLTEYRRKVEEKFGKRKEESVRDDISKDKIATNPPSDKTVIVTGKGDFLCYDTVSGRYFRSSTNQLQKAENTLNFRLRDEMFVELNELYLELNLPPIEIGGKLGWNVDKGPIQFHFTYGPAPEYNDEPCLMVQYDVQPYYHYI